MTHLRTAALAGFVALIFSLPLQATTVTLSPDEIKAFTQLDATGDPMTFKTSESALGAGFTTAWLFDVSGPQSANVGLAGLGYDWSGHDSFAILIANHNENTWDFSVSVSDGTNTNTSAVQSLPNDDELQLFVVDLTGLNHADIQSVYITVAGDLPIAGHDRTAEYRVQIVPVPAAAWMFGSALGLLAWVRRRSV
ncbi:MAG: VPLPA-CTERM sorting domain-containing protein [Gammaproteobacteria bacterium]|nr:VPLPA-CTERM sorting domain-containing protein [Gammaproteobacteria bacterium]